MAPAYRFAKPSLNLPPKRGGKLVLCERGMFYSRLLRYSSKVASVGG